MGELAFPRKKPFSSWAPRLLCQICVRALGLKPPYLGHIASHRPTPFQNAFLATDPPPHHLRSWP